VGVTKNLALKADLARVLAGHALWLIDADGQKSLETAIFVHSQTGLEPTISFSSFSEGLKLFSQIHAKGKKYEDIVISVGGRDTSALRVYLTVTDILLIPFLLETLIFRRFLTLLNILLNILFKILPRRIIIRLFI
jgi:hypothetical protein